MPCIDFTDAELKALHAVYTIAQRVDWPAYERARRRIIAAGRGHLCPTTCEATDARAASDSARNPRP